MRVTVLGSGSAWSECGCNAGYLVDGRVLVDCGAPVPALVRRAETSVQEITLILLTHFHADHTFALPTVLDARAYAAQPTPGTLVVAGPVGTREYVSRLITTGYGSHARRTIEANVDPEFVVLQDGSAIELAGYRVEAHAVMHSVGPSLAYRLTDANGATVGFSGDSELCAGLRRSIAGCALYVCECTGWDAPAPGGHLWREEVAGLVAEYPATTFLLSHLAERRELEGALVAHDLLSLEISPVDG
ncbi:MAG TPA: MBL fold metallo-hydrolase [Candidatus Dormibacteraeota bacterium]